MENYITICTYMLKKKNVYKNLQITYLALVDTSKPKSQN